MTIKAAIAFITFSALANYAAVIATSMIASDVNTVNTQQEQEQEQEQARNKEHLVPTFSISDLRHLSYSKSRSSNNDNVIRSRSDEFREVLSTTGLLAVRLDDNDDDDNNLEVWTILSTAKFAKKHKAPQEFLPEDVIQNVTKLLVKSLQEDIIGNNDVSDDITTTLLQNQIVESRLQLWGAAVPMNVWRGDPNSNIKTPTEDLGSSGFIYDPRYQVGVCGDWLMEPSIAGAWTSGRRLAQHLVDATSGNNESENSFTTESVGFKKGHFEASQSVKRLGIASLDGPIHSD